MRALVTTLALVLSAGGCDRDEPSVVQTKQPELAVQSSHAEQADDDGSPEAETPTVAAANGLPKVSVGDVPAARQPIEDPKGSLQSFYRALRHTDAKSQGALTRILHMGDSSIGLDGLPHAIRTRLQDRFGDGGVGFVLLGRYSTNYKNNAAAIDTGKGWDICYIAYGCRKDGRYGLGGHVFRGSSGAVSTVGTKQSGEYGRKASKVEVWYEAGPRGGRLQMRVDRGEVVELDTRAEAPEDRWHSVDVQPGPHKVMVRAAGGGYARAFGVVMETEGPGVVWDTVSMIGAFTKRLDLFDKDHFASQLDHRNPDLLVLNYGGNDLRRLVSRSVTPEKYKEEYGSVLDKLLAGKPDLPCLVVSVIDHGRSGSQDVKPRHVDAMVGAQREVAFAKGCAFFDSVAAMGGAGSLKKWRKLRPPMASPDLKHLNARGRDHIGGMMFEALMAGYVAQVRADDAG